YQFLSEQLAELEAERRVLLQSSQDASLEKVRQLMQLNGIGINGAWVLGREFFGGRALKNRREVGGSITSPQCDTAAGSSWYTKKIYPQYCCGSPQGAGKDGQRIEEARCAALAVRALARPGWFPAFVRDSAHAGRL